MKSIINKKAFCWVMNKVKERTELSFQCCNMVLMVLFSGTGIVSDLPKIKNACSYGKMWTWFLYTEHNFDDQTAGEPTLRQAWRS